MIQGYTPTQILENLLADFPMTTAKTVENDLAALNRAFRDTVTTLDVEHELGRALAAFDELESLAWAAYDSESRVKAKMLGLKTISEIRSARLKLLERAGLLVKRKQVIHEDGSTWEEMIIQLRRQRGIENEQ